MDESEHYLYSVQKDQKNQAILGKKLEITEEKGPPLEFPASQQQ